MRALIKISIAVFVLLFTLQAQAIDVVELKQKNSNKVVFKIRFDNGSSADPADKKGLTFATASLMSQGGAGGTSYAALQDKMMPWAAGYGAFVDKQVTTFTFQVLSISLMSSTRWSGMYCYHLISAKRTSVG